MGKKKVFKVLIHEGYLHKLEDARNPCEIWLRVLKTKSKPVRLPYKRITIEEVD
jgi:hypothetical protein